jgi:hypothetical protein
VIITGSDRSRRVDEFPAKVCTLGSIVTTLLFCSWFDLVLSLPFDTSLPFDPFPFVGGDTCSIALGFFDLSVVKIENEVD